MKLVGCKCRYQVIAAPNARRRARASEAELAELPSDLQARFLHINEMREELELQKIGILYVLWKKLWEMRMDNQ